MSTNEALKEFLAGFRRHIRVYDGWLLTQQIAPFAILASMVVLGLGRFFPIENLILWAALPASAWLLAVWIYALLRPQSAMAVAARVDEQANLQERLSSSLYFCEHPESASQMPDSYRPALIDSLHADALTAARGLNIRQAFPFESRKWPLLTAAGLALACLLLAVLPNPMNEVLAERRSVAAEAQRQAEAIEALKDEIEQASELDKNEKEELRKALEELAMQLRENPGDIEQALADLSRLEEALRPRLDTNSQNEQAAIQALARRMQDLAGQEPSPREAGDLQAAASALGEMAEKSASLSSNESLALSQELSVLGAQAAQNGDLQLAQALAAMAEAVKRGDSTGTKKASEEAKTALANAQKRKAQQTALNKTLAQLQSSRQAMAGSCKNPGMAAGTTPGQGQNQGKGSGTGGGSQANVLPPNTGGAMNLHGPSGSKPVDAADLLGQNIFAPRLAGQENGSEELQIGGQDSGQGQEQVTASNNPLPGGANPALTPYREVYREYLDAANQAMEQSYIPGYLKDYVKSYFSQLEP
jgi:acetylornithine deacetylase/succinyl-diaminopimelate desuccinylase-like protein